MAFNFSPKIPNDGLILYYDPLNVKSYISGTIVTDLTRNVANGVLTNGVGFNGKNFVFDGLDDYILVNSNSLIYSIQVNMTIMGWFNDNGVRTTPTIFSQYLNTTPGNLVKVVRVQAGTFVYFTSNNVAPGFQVFLISNAYSFNTWNFFSVTVNGSLSTSTINLRVNNLKQTFTSTQMAVPNTNVEVRIGSAQNTFQQSNEFFAGGISSLLVYNKVLSDTEIDFYYNATKSRFNIL